MIATAPTRADVQARLATAQAEILQLGVRRLALFGSVHRNAARPDSDIDLLVEFEPGQKSYDHFLALGDLLERLLNHSVELVTLEALSPFLRPHILADATDVIRAA
jgi:predicted nucleotidyltransferase